MKIALTIIGVLLILVGGVWFFQGIGVLLGSVMSRQTQWAFNGGLAVIIGIGLIILAYRRRASPPKK